MTAAPAYQCGKCGSTKQPNLLGIPDLVQGGHLVKGGDWLECQDCGQRRPRDMPQQPGNAASTRKSLTASKGAARQCAAFARTTSPRSQAKFATIADHGHITSNLESATGWTAQALTWLSDGIRHHFAGSDDGTGHGLQRTIARASCDLQLAARKAAGARDDVQADTRKLPKGSRHAVPASAQPARRSALTAADAANCLSVTLRQSAGQVTLDGYGAVTGTIAAAVRSLRMVYANEARLIDGAYEDAGMSRAAARISGPLRGADPDLQRASRSLGAALASLDDAAGAARVAAAKVRRTA